MKTFLGTTLILDTVHIGLLKKDIEMDIKISHPKYSKAQAKKSKFIGKLILA